MSKESEAVTKAIRELTVAFEKDRVVYPTTLSCAFAPTGELFQTFTSGGPKPEGVSMGIICFSWQIALSWLARHLAAYKNITPGSIYWRQRPALNIETYFKAVDVNPLLINNEATMRMVPLFYAYCRVLISDKIILSDEEYGKLTTGGKTVGQLLKDAHRSTPQPDEGRGDGKLEGH